MFNWAGLRMSPRWFINTKKRKISYFDSMGGGLINGNGVTHQQTILEYLQKEYKDKKGIDLPSDWVINAEGVDDDNNVIHTIVRIPQQKNGSDCGVFTCRFAECIGIADMHLSITPLKRICPTSGEE